MNKPMTRKQASHICDHYQFIAGMAYDPAVPGTSPVLGVMVAPFSEEAQREFIDDMDLLGYTDLNAFDVDGGYDVIVLSRYLQDEEICVWMDLRSFVKQNMARVVQQRKKCMPAATGDKVVV